jgi:hypothetical protein
MFQRNNILFGFALAAVVTAVVYALLYLVNHVVLPMVIGREVFSKAFLLIISLGVNILPMRYYSDYKAHKTARGMMIFVFLFAAYIIYVFFGEEFGFSSPDGRRPYGQ